MLHSCMKPSVLKQFKRYNGVLAQLGEHLPYKQRVIGSSPIGPIFMYKNGRGMIITAVFVRSFRPALSLRNNLLYDFEA